MNINPAQLRADIETLLLAEQRQLAEGTSANQQVSVQDKLLLFKQLCAALEQGLVRVAQPTPEAANKSGPVGRWQVNSWVKGAILWGFRYGSLAATPGCCGAICFDKITLPLRQLTLQDQVRLVPGGSSVRCGVYLAPGIVMMPPSYINIGAYLAPGVMVDSHVLVGSGAQIGRSVHLAAGVQIGGVLEPVGSLPVIVEDDAFIGGSCGLYEGVLVERGAVLASGVVLNHGIKIFDQVYGRFIEATDGKPLVVPAGAVVVPGSRPLQTPQGIAHQIQVSCPVIIKYRDNHTDSVLQLEVALRE